MTWLARVEQRFAWLGVAALTTVVLFGEARALGQLPAARLTGIYPAGGQAGQTVEVTLFGNDLDDAEQLWFSHPGLRAERKMAEPGPFDKGPQPVANVFLVHIPGDVPAGCYDVRVLGMYGLSNPRTFEVSGLAEVNEVEPNNESSQAQSLSLPTVVNAQSAQPGDIDYFRVALTAGRRVTLRCVAQRLDSRVDPVLQVTDATGRLLAEYDNVVGRDIVMDFTAPADGDYFLVVHDALYRGSAENVYRLTLTESPVVDFVFPPMVAPGTTARLAVYGRNLPGGSPTDLQVDGRPLEKLEMDVAMPADALGKLPQSVNVLAERSNVDAIELRLPGERQPLDVPLVYPATAPVVLEKEPHQQPSQAQVLTPPCEVAGQFYPQRDVDWYQFDAKQGEVWSIELYYNRLGAAGAPRLVVQRIDKKQDGSEQVSQVAEVRMPQARDFTHEFDPRSGDWAYLLAVPSDGSYRLMVHDGHAALRRDPRLVYRLAVRKPQPDFRLVAVPWESDHGLFLRKGGRAAVRVLALRQDGYDGEILVTASGLPEGVTATEAVIGPGNTTAAIILTCAENAQPAIGTVHVQGRAVIDGKEVTRPAVSGAALEAQNLLQPGEQRASTPARLTRGLVVSISREEMLPAMITLGEQPLWETSRGGLLKIPYSVTRRENFNGSITGMTTDLPRNVEVTQVGIGNGATSGEFEVRIPGNAPTGTYTVFLNGFVQGYQYARNPGAAKAAAERKAELEKIVAESQEKVKQATEVRNTAQRELDEAKSAVQKAQAARDQAAKVAADRDAALKAAVEASQRAKRAAEEQPGDAGRAEAAAQAAKAAAEAETRAKEAATALATAEKNVADAQEALKKAEAKRAEAEQTLQKATQFATLAQQAKQQADQRAQQLQNAAQPRPVNFWTPSTPVKIRIVESPVAVEGVSDAVAFKQGEKLEVPVRITRSYGFDGPVNLNWQAPGISGVQLGNVQIPNGQNEGKLTITAAENAAVGEYPVKIQIQLNFNGQNVVTEKSLRLVVNAKQ